jgi:hypothetical protein
MYIEVDKNRLQILSAFEDHREINGVLCPCAHILFKDYEQANKLLKKPLVVYSDDGKAIQTFSSYDSVFGCEVTLYCQSQIEKELEQTKAELASVKAERDELKKSKQ